MYEYKTITQDVVPDLDVQQKLDDSLNLLCREEGWEVLNVAVVVFYLGDTMLQKVYTLRRRVDDVGMYFRYPMIAEHYRRFKEKEATERRIQFFLERVEEAMNMSEHEWRNLPRLV